MFVSLTGSGPQYNLTQNDIRNNVFTLGSVAYTTAMDFDQPILYRRDVSHAYDLNLKSMSLPPSPAGQQPSAKKTTKKNPLLPLRHTRASKTFYIVIRRYSSTHMFTRYLVGQRYSN